MVSRSVHHQEGGRERSGYADSRRDDPQPDGSGDGDTPVAQGGATPAAGRQEREAGRLGHVQHHPQHRGRGAQGRPHRPQREACEHQLPARRRDESRHAEGGLRVAGQNRGRRHGFRRR